MVKANKQQDHHGAMRAQSPYIYLQPFNPKATREPSPKKVQIHHKRRIRDTCTSEFLFLNTLLSLCWFEGSANLVLTVSDSICIGGPLIYASITLGSSHVYAV